MKNHKLHYFILVSFSLLLNVSKINAQSNNCTTATPITLTNHTGCANGTTVGAVTDNTFYGGCNPSPTTVNMVWYTYITDGPNNNFTITPGTLTNAELVIYTGDCPANGGILQTCANANGSSVLSTTWGLPSGTQVWLGVASYAGTEGTFQLCVTSTPSTPSSGSNCTNAKNICTFTGFTVNPMTANSSGQTSSCFTNPVQRDVWIKFTVTKSGLLSWTAMPTVSTTEFDWTIWDITSGCPGTEFCCNYNFANGSSSGFGMHTGAGTKACGYSGAAGTAAEFAQPKAVTCGHTYAIQISNYSNNSNGFSIAFTGSTCEVTTTLPFTPSPTLYCGSSMLVNITNTFDGTDCSTVTWDFGDGSPTVTTTGTANPPAHTYTTPGTYAITASVAGICPETSTEYVQLLGPLATTATATNETCPGSCDGTADVTSATGGDGTYTYLWSNGSTATSLTGLCNGSYTVTVSNATCGTSVNQTVVVNSSSSTPAPTVAPIAYCQGDVASALTASGSNLLWYTTATGGVGSPTAPTPSTTTAGATTYYVSQTISGCEGPRASIIVTINALPIANAGADMVLTCTTTQVTLDGSGSTLADNYSWTGGTIVSGGTTTAPIVSAAGTYTLTVTNPTGGCTATDAATVTLNNTPPIANAGADMVITCTTTQVTLDGAGSTLGDNYNWTGGTIVSGGTTTAPIVNAAGTYTLTVTDPTNGCTATDAANVTLNNTPPIANAGADMVLTCATTQVTLDGSGSTLGDNYSWTGGTIVSGGTTTAPIVNAAGTYTLTVTDPSNGCTATDAANVTLNNTPPIANAGADMVLTCTTTQVTLDGSGSTLGDNYNWTGGTIVSGGTTTAPIVNASGTYTLTVTDPTNGCTATDNVDVTLNNTPPTANAGADMVLTCTTTQITLDGSGSTLADNYNWTGGTIVSGGTTTAPIVNAAGTYTLTVTDPTNGCTATDNVDVTLNNTPPNVDAGPDQTLTCTNPTVPLAGTSSTSGATFNWTGGTIVSGGTTLTPDVSAAGTYTLTVTDPTNGCTATDNTLVNSAVGTPNVSAGADTVLTCTTIQAPLNGSSSTGGATFSWSGPGIVSGGTSATPIVNAVGTYTLTVTDPSNGCTATDAANVTLNNTPPIANAGADMVLTCTTTQVTLDGSGSTLADNYNWTGGTIVSGGTTTAPIVSAAGTYTLTVTDPINGCTATDAANVTLNNTPPIANAGADMILTCTTTQVTLDGSGSTLADNYNWTGGTIVSGGTTTAPIVNAAGTYTLTVTDPTNGCTATDNVDVTLNNTPPNVDAGPDQTLTCTNPTVPLAGTSSTSGATFNWTGGTIVSGGTSLTPDVSAAGTYTLTVTDPTNGCTATDNTLVNSAVGTPNVSAGADTVLTCTTIQAPLNGSSSTGGTTFSWSGPGIVSGGTSATPIVNAVGTYTLTVTDPSNGCTATDAANVTLNNTPPIANAGADKILTCAITSINLDGTGSTPGDNYSWTGGTITSGGTTETPTVSAAGTYTLTVTDPTNGCTATDNANVTLNNTPPTVNAGPDQTVCEGTQVTLSASGSGGNYTWNNGVVNNTPFIPTDTTTYTVTGTGANGCTATDDVTVNVIPTPVVNFVGDKLSGCSPLTTTFTNNSTGNLVGCQWSFSDGNSATGCGSVSETFINVGCYNVTLTVSTPEGCTNSMTKTNYVCVVPNPVADFNITPNQLTTSDTHAQLTNTSTGGDTYIWNFGDASGTSTDFSPSHSFPSDNSGTYTITLYVTSADGCMDTTSQTIKVVEDLIFYVPNTFTPDNDDFNETFQPVFTSGFDPYDFTLYIFDRWGEVLFESHNAKIGWDGTYGGKLVQDGTYVWKIMFKLKDQDKHEIHVGHVNVLK